MSRSLLLDHEACEAKECTITRGVGSLRGRIHEIGSREQHAETPDVGAEYLPASVYPDRESVAEERAGEAVCFWQTTASYCCGITRDPRDQDVS